MHWTRRTGIGVAIFAEAIGAVFLAATVYYTILYFVDANNPLRHEYMMGVNLGLLYGTGAFLAASVLAGTLRRSLSGGTFRWLAWPGLAVGGVFFALYLVSISLGLLHDWI